MSLRILSVAPPLVSLFYFSTFVVAGVDVAGVDVTANCTLSSYLWTFNSVGQSPCTVAAYMLSTCYSGSYTLAPLPTGHAYSGPTHGYSNKCQCSTVGYSLISACAACQDRQPFYWSKYVVNCTTVLPPSQFPNPVPAGIYVPHWAILDVTNENIWNANESYVAGDIPEYGSGAIIGASSGYNSSGYTSSASASSTGSPSTVPPKGSSSNASLDAGAIAGGIVGGIAFVSLAVAAILYLRLRSSAPSTRSTSFDALQPNMNEIPRPGSNGVTTVRPSSMASSISYTQDVPKDQTTFQWYAGPHSVDIGHPGSTPSHIGSGSSLVNTQTSLPQTMGYHGFPIPSV